jgi:hypothetical protein
MSGTFEALIKDAKGAGYGAQGLKPYANSGKTVGQSLKTLESFANGYNDLLPTQGQERVSKAQIIKVIAANLKAKMPASGYVLGRGNDAAKTALGQIEHQCQNIINDVTCWPKIPKTIHIIHLGGPLPSARFTYVLPNIHSFKKVNRDATVNLWIDRSFLKTAEFNAMAQDAATHGYQIMDFMTTMEPKAAVESRQISPGGPTMVNVVDNSSDAGKLYGLIDQLLSKKGQLNNNPGAVSYNWGLISDLMRIAILLRYGGIYFDTDMAAGEALPAVLYAKQGILVNVKGFQMTPCNDIIAVTAAHQVMQDYRTEIIAKMTTKGSTDLFKRLIDKTAPPKEPNNPVLRSATIQTSGPTTLRTVIQKNVASTKTDAEILPGGRFATVSMKPNILIGKDYSTVIFPPCYVRDSSTSGKAWLA